MIQQLLSLLLLQSLKALLDSKWKRWQKKESLQFERLVANHFINIYFKDTPNSTLPNFVFPNCGTHFDQQIFGSSKNIWGRVYFQKFLKSVYFDISFSETCFSCKVLWLGYRLLWDFFKKMKNEIWKWRKMKNIKNQIYSGGLEISETYFFQ